MLSSGLRYRKLPRWRHRSFGQAGTTLLAQGSEDGQETRQEIPIFITTSIITTGMFTTDRRFILFYY